MENQAYHFKDLEDIPGVEFALSLDGRNVTFRCETRNGLKEKTFSLPSAIVRGDYQTKTTYYHGDIVRHSNELWHCEVSATQSEPSSKSADWIKAS